MRWWWKRFVRVVNYRVAMQYIHHIYIYTDINILQLYIRRIAQHICIEFIMLTCYSKWSEKWNLLACHIYHIHIYSMHIHICICVARRLSLYILIHIYTYWYIVLYDEHICFYCFRFFEKIKNYFNKFERAFKKSSSKIFVDVYYYAERIVFLETSYYFYLFW